MKGQPQGLIAAALANMGERFGFYIMMAILTLFISAKFGLDEATAGYIYSGFYASIYLLALVGGIIADKTKNYKGTIEFDKGCVLVGYGEIVSQKAIVDAAYALESGVAMTAPTALVGEVVSIDSAWSDEYQNITVTIVCDGLTEQPIQCYRLSGEGAQALEVGSVVGVYGTIKNYKGTIEFDKGCTLDAVVKAE